MNNLETTRDVLGYCKLGGSTGEKTICVGNK